MFHGLISALAGMTRLVDLCAHLYFVRREYSDIAASLPTVSYYKENP